MKPVEKYYEIEHILNFLWLPAGYDLLSIQIVYVDGSGSMKRKNIIDQVQPLNSGSSCMNRFKMQLKSQARVVLDLPALGHLTI